MPKYLARPFTGPRPPRRREPLARLRASLNRFNWRLTARLTTPAVKMGAVSLFAAGITALYGWKAISAFQTGTVEDCARTCHGMVTRAADPGDYWFNTGFDVVVGVVALLAFIGVSAALVISFFVKDDRPVMKIHR